jgi:predicted DNA-binding transcriptional regulator YafY
MNTPHPKKTMKSANSTPSQSRAKPLPKSNKKKRGRKKKRVTTQRAVSARLEIYHALFAALFADPDPNKRYPSYAGLAMKLGFTKSMVRRDIEHLRNDYKWPLEFIEKYGGWGYTEEVLRAPTVKMTKGQLVLICAAWKSLEGCRGTPQADQAAEAFERWVEALGPEVGVNLRKVRDRISFMATSYYSPVDPKVFETVSAALFDDEELRFDYRKLNRAPVNNGRNGKAKPEPEKRHVQPRHLLQYDGGWYIYSDDIHADFKRRTFALARMKSARQTGVHFVPKGEFNIDEELRPGFGIHGSGEECIVKLRYYGVSAQLAAERNYRGMQSLVENNDRTVDLTLKTVIAPELRRFVFGSGSEVDILEPSDFRRDMCEEARRMVTRWSADVPGLVD